MQMHVLPISEQMMTTADASALTRLPCPYPITLRAENEKNATLPPINYGRSLIPLGESIPLKKEFSSEKRPSKDFCETEPTDSIESPKINVGKSFAAEGASSIVFGTPILTNVITRNDMAIIKVDHAAIMMLKQLCRKNQQFSKLEDPGFFSMQFKHASTKQFQLSLGSENDVINATFKLFVNGCSSSEEGKFVSVFVEISPKNSQKATLGPFIVTVFLKNLKDESGASYKRSFKMIPDANQWLAMERGLREFVHVDDFDRCLEKEEMGGNLVFGVMVQSL